MMTERTQYLSPETREFRNNLIQMGNNLNQIARKINAHGVDEPTMSELRMTLDYIRELKEQLNS